MGFFRGVVTGVAVAAGVAAWYMSRSGERVREQYRFERRLGELGDQIEARTREIQGTLNTQLTEMRARTEMAGDAPTTTSSNGHDAAEALDSAAASAAEAAAEVAAEAEARTVRIKRAAGEAAADATGDAPASTAD